MIIAEIGQNHQGDINIAKKMIKADQDEKKEDKQEKKKEKKLDDLKDTQNSAIEDSEAQTREKGKERPYTRKSQRDGAIWTRRSRSCEGCEKIT